MSTDYPFLAISLTMLLFFLLVFCGSGSVALALTDIVRRGDIGGPTKAFFTLCVIALPRISAPSSI